VHEKGDGAVHVTHADGRTNRYGNPGSADTALAGKYGIEHSFSFTPRR